MTEKNIPIPESGRDLFVTDTIANEVLPHLKYHNRKFPPDLRKIVITKPRTSPEYQSIYQQLEKANVGERDGISDRMILSDLFFAAREDGVEPRFITADKEIYQKLYSLTGRQTRLPGKSTDEPLPDEFEINLKDSNGITRTISIIPILLHKNY